MINKERTCTIQQGRELFANEMRKYWFDEKSIEVLKDYYGYFWNLANNDSVPKMQANILLHCPSMRLGSKIAQTIESMFIQHNLLKNINIGYSFMGEKEDTNQIIYLFSAENQHKPDVQNARNQYSSIIIGVPMDGEFDANQVLLDAGTQLYYRDFRYHLHMDVAKEQLFCFEVCDILEENHTCTKQFKQDMLAYIKHVLPNREIEDDDAFVNDIVNRVRGKYLGRQDYSDGFEINESFVPDYIKKEPPTVEQTSAPETVKHTIQGIEDIDPEHLENENIQNVLFLNMSTLAPRGVLKKNKYTYEDECLNIDREHAIEGYGQLEPVPQLLANSILKSEDKTLDLIIISSTPATNKSIDIEIDIDGKSEKLSTSAIAFFKYRIHQTCGKNVRFYTIDITDEATAIYKTTDIIRKLKNITDKKEPDTFRLYMDIHGGLRDTQLLFDAIVNTLSIEGITVHDAFTCSFGNSGDFNEIEKVTRKLQIFRFVSGMNEFIHYGYGKELMNYVKNCGNDSDREKLVERIQAVSNALSLCDISRFYTALDNLNDAILTHPDDDRLFQIFTSNIKSAYGDLLDRKTRSLYETVKWATNNSFYQQALAIIEAKTPEYVFDRLFKESTAKLYVTNTNAFFDINEHKDNHEENSTYLLRHMFYKGTPEHKDQITSASFTNTAKTAKRPRPKKELVTLVLEKKEFFDWNTFIRFGDQWMKLKDKRNKVFHVSKNNQTSVEELRTEILTYLKELEKLNKSIHPINSVLNDLNDDGSFAATVVKITDKCIWIKSDIELPKYYRSSNPIDGADCFISKTRKELRSKELRSLNVGARINVAFHSDRPDNERFTFIKKV